MEKRIFLLTGQPGVGKTTVLVSVVSSLRGRGVSVGGMFSREIRKEGVREGFEIVDVGSAKVGCLASVYQKDGPQVGKYRVNLADLESIGVAAINRAVEQNDVVAIDEIGPMELFSQKFRQATQKALDSDKLVFTVVHWKSRDTAVADVKGRADAEIVTVTTENRDGLADSLVEKAVAFLNKAS